jgi:hypothetical protein
VRLTLIGMVLLLLAFFGSQFVLEVLLKRVAIAPAPAPASSAALGGHCVLHDSLRSSFRRKPESSTSRDTHQHG